MESIKKSLPDEKSLSVRMDEVWGDLTDKLLRETYGERAELKKYRWPLLVAIVITIPLLGYIWLTGGGTLTYIGAIVSFVFASYYSYWWYEAHKVYTKKLNKLMYEMVFKFFGLKATHFADKNNPESVTKQNEVLWSLSLSELLTERKDKIHIGDVFLTTFTGNEMLVSELFATRNEGSGKNLRTVTVFKGLFTSFKLPKQLTGTTFISTEGDETGYGHRDFWGRIKGMEKVEETILEWNEFEKYLHVATTDGSEARYILTPDFMVDLYDWWKESKRNIRIVFRDSELYMLFPDTNITVKSTISSSNTKVLKKYAMTIITPIWHVLKLLDDVNKRFPS